MAATAPARTGSAVPAASYPQVMPAGAWTIVHGLGRRPLVEIVDELNRVVLPDDVIYLDRNTVQVTFNVPQAGRALLA